MKDIVFPAAKRCIYCDATKYSEARDRLGDEHIVPEFLEGNLVLPEAACDICERQINKDFENLLAQGPFASIRYHLQLKGKRRKKPWPSLLPLKDTDGNVVMELPPEKFPHVLRLPGLAPPSALTGATATQHLAWTMVANPASLKNSAAALGRDLSLALGHINPEQFYRLLAKIAHAYMIARTGFLLEPLLLPIIRQGTTPELMKFIGGRGFKLPPPTRLWEISPAIEVSRDGTVYFCVHIRLFGNFGAPPYVIVAGKLPEALDWEPLIERMSATN